MIRETLDDGVDGAVISSIHTAASHLEELGCSVTEVLLCPCKYMFPEVINSIREFTHAAIQIFLVFVNH